ncbi:macB-like periplasmic core domain protein, partial [Vibrio parahaemolyticus VPTS-2010]
SKSMICSLNKRVCSSF